MEEEILNDSFPDLRELESKVGRKTPDSLLIWMRDAADCEDGWKPDVDCRGDRSSAFKDSFSDKISNLKQEMRWLRSADVRILRQLVAVHEGIEAMRWLMEERDAFASRGSSLTGSLSSLVTVEEHEPSMSPYRESLSQTPDLAETAGEGSEDLPPPHTDRCDSNHECYFDMLSPTSSEVRPPSPSTSSFEVATFTHGRHGQASSGPANGLVNADLPQSQPRDSDVAPLHYIKTGANTIRRALARSNRPRRELKGDNGIFALTKQSEDKQTERLRASHNSMMENEASAPDKETTLPGYDAQWCWVESQDDVTFL